MLAQELPDHALCMSLDEYRAASKPRILLVHYELLPSIIKKVVKIPWDLVIVDESQRLKGRGTGQSRYLRRLRKSARRVALSGTPLDDSEIDLWGQMRFIEPLALSDKWSDFDNHFLKPEGFMGYGRAFRKEMKQEFNERVNPFCLVIERHEVGLSEPNLQWIPVLMLGEQRRIYDAMERDWLTTINGQKVSTKLEITNRIKLQQITGGFLKDDDGTVHQLRSAKATVLRSLLRKKVEKPAIIFCQFLPDVELCKQICEEFSDNVRTLTGALKDKKRDKHRTDLILAFQLGEIDYLVCQQRTGGVGIDLYRSRNAVVYSHDESWIDFEQMKSRMDDPSQSASKIFSLFCTDSIDIIKKQSILTKQSVTDIILMNLKTGRLR